MPKAKGRSPRGQGSAPHSEPPGTPTVICGSARNLNSFSEQDAYLEECGEDCSIDIDNSFTIKAGFGVDLFVLFENAAINIEIAWKHNKADIVFFSGETQFGADDYNGSALVMLLGLRYHFPITTP